MSCWQVAGGKTNKRNPMVAICAWLNTVFAEIVFEIAKPDLDKVKDIPT